MRRAHHQQPKLKTQLFSCGFFGHCTRTVLSPTATHSPILPSTPHQLPPAANSDQRQGRSPLPDSESSSSSASQSFTQWRFPLQLPHSPVFSQPLSDTPPQQQQPMTSGDLKEIFHVAELQLSDGSEADRLAALQILERSLVPNPSLELDCTTELMHGLVGNLNSKTGSKPATKILLALCLGEGNRHLAVEAGAVGAVIESLPKLEDAAAERALACLELMCTVAEGAGEVRGHALSVPSMVTMMGRMGARGKEYAISVLAVIYGNEFPGEAEAETAPPEEVAKAVVLALQGDSSARGRRKAAQLLKALKEQQDGCSTAAI